MASGDTTVFHQFKVDIWNEIHDADNDVYKIGLITSAVTPAANASAPHWGGTGTTNYATSEVTPGGNYTAGGVTLTSIDYINSGGTVPWRAAKVTIAQDALNPTNARWGIIYNSTDANKRAVAFVDLGSDRDLTTGPFELRFNSVDGVGAVINVA